MYLVVWTLAIIFRKVETSTHHRCLDLPASSSNQQDQCKSMADGYSWFQDSQDCKAVQNASCAITGNKFKTKDQCMAICGVESGQDSRCRSIPLVFAISNTDQCDVGFRPRPCPDAELHSLALFYYDWNVQKCYQSHVGVCPDDESRLFSEKFNSFPTRLDCLKSKSLMQIPSSAHPIEIS